MRHQMKPVSEAEEILLQSVSLHAKARWHMEKHWIDDDARMRMKLKHSIIAVAICVLLTATLLLMCYRRDRPHVGPPNNWRRLAAGRPGQEDDDEDDESSILESCLDLESDLALSGQHLNPLQDEREAIEALTSYLLAEAEDFESGDHGAFSAFTSEPLDMYSAHANLFASTSPSPATIGIPSNESRGFQGAAFATLGVGLQGQMFYTHSPYPETDSSVYPHRSPPSRQPFDYAMSEFEPLKMSDLNTSQDAAIFTSDSEGANLSYSVDLGSAVHAAPTPSFLQLPGLADLSRLTAGEKHSFASEEGGKGDLPTQKASRTEREAGKVEIRDQTDVERNGGFAQIPSSSSTSASQPLAAATQHLLSQPHTSQSTRLFVAASGRPRLPSEEIQRVPGLPPNPRILEGGVEVVGDALGDLEEEGGFNRRGYMSIRLRSGEEIRVPHPPPPLKPGCCESYRLPRVPPSSIRTEFGLDLSLAPVKFRGIPILLRIMHDVFSQRELTEEQVESLCRASEELVNYLFFHHQTSLNHEYPHRAADRLALRYLCFEALVCAIETLGPAMNAQQWFPKLVRAIPIEYKYSGGERFRRARHYISISQRLTQALRQLKMGVRPSPEETHFLKRALFDERLAPAVLRSSQFDFMRKAFEDSHDSSSTNPREAGPSLKGDSVFLR
ncbi:hypothetical protein ACSSS7_003213 [Eimeria intestinalis]